MLFVAIFIYLRSDRIKQFLVDNFPQDIIFFYNHYRKFSTWIVAYFTNVYNEIIRLVQNLFYYIFWQKIATSSKLEVMGLGGMDFNIFLP